MKPMFIVTLGDIVGLVIGLGVLLFFGGCLLAERYAKWRRGE